MSASHCTNCGTPLAERGNYCGDCGHPTATGNTPPGPRPPSADNEPHRPPGYRRPGPRPFPQPPKLHPSDPFVPDAINMLVWGTKLMVLLSVVFVLTEFVFGSGEPLLYLLWDVVVEMFRPFFD